MWLEGKHKLDTTLLSLYIDKYNRDLRFVKKYIGLPIFKKKPIGRYGPQKIS